MSELFKLLWFDLVSELQIDGFDHFVEPFVECFKFESSNYFGTIYWASELIANITKLLIYLSSTSRTPFLSVIDKGKFFTTYKWTVNISVWEEETTNYDLLAVNVTRTEEYPVESKINSYAVHQTMMWKQVLEKK